MDYSAVVRSKPVAKPPSKSGTLGFAPKAVRIYPIVDGLVQSPGGSFGYALSLAQKPKRWKPNWRVRWSISRVRSDGTLGGEINSRKKVLSSLEELMGAVFDVPLTAGTGLYRYTIDFQRLNGSGLGKFSQYVRVLPRHFAARLSADPLQVSRSQSIHYKVENLGTVPISFDERSEVQIRGDSGWRPSEIGYVKPMRRARVLFPGEATGCMNISIPETAALGQYRVKVDAWTDRARNPRHLYVPFTVG